MSADSRIAGPTMSYSITAHWTGANTSGLPVPTSVVAGTTGAEGNKSAAQQQERKIPSTVGSALRRRQASSVSQQANDKVPNISHSALTTFGSSQQQQQQQQAQIRPPSKIRQSPSNITYSSLSKLALTATKTTTTTSTSSSFKAHLRLAPSTTNSSGNAIARNNSAIAALKMKQRQLSSKTVGNNAANSEMMCEDEDDRVDVDVESLPPLKSTSYINQISTTDACDNGALNGRKQSQPGIRGGYRSSSSSVVSLASSQDLRSEPILSRTISAKTPAMITTNGTNRITREPSGRHLYQSAQSLAKPSQLVKPMLQRNTSSSKFGLKKITGLNTTNTRPLAAQQVNAGRQLPSRQVSKASAQSNTGSRLSFSQLQQPAPVQGIHNRESELATLPSKILIGSLTSPANRVAQPMQQSSSGDNRRLSLKPSIQMIRQPVVQSELPDRHSTSRRDEVVPNHCNYSYSNENKQEEEVESEDFVDANDDSNESDEIGASEDEESIIASHSSDTIQTANRELDNMIQMLTSRAIISSSDSRAKPIAQKAEISGEATFVSDSNVSRETLCGSSSHMDLTLREDPEPKNCETSAEVQEEVRVPRKLSIKRRSNNVSRSQSMSVRKRGLSTSQVSSVGLDYCGSDGFMTGCRMNNALPRRSASIKSARPRSRVIFDPMKSEFHVSCTTDADSSESVPDRDDTLPDVTTELNSSRKDDLTLSSDGDNTSDDDGDLPELTADLEQTKTTPTNNNDNTIESESSRKLLEAQSKIMSLTMSLPFAITKSDPRDPPSRSDRTTELVKTSEKSYLPPKCPTPKRCKSPVGSTLRSLLGLGASSNNKQETPAFSATEDGKKVATVVRYSSSLRVPVATNRCANIPTSVNAKTTSAETKKQPSDAAEGNPSLIDYYNYGTIQHSNDNICNGQSIQNSPGSSLLLTAHIRPPSMVSGYLRSSPSRSISSFKTRKSYDEECKSMYDNDDEEEVKCLPNLNSTSYISRISSSAGFKSGSKQPGTSDYRSSEPAVRPAAIPTAAHRTLSCNRYQSPARQFTRPSQLVRPMLQKNTGSNQVSRPGLPVPNMKKQDENTSASSRKLSWPQQQQPVVYGLIQRQSRLPTPPIKSSIGSLKIGSSAQITRLHYNARQVRQSIVPPTSITCRLDDIGKSDDIRSTSETSACSYSTPEEEEVAEDFADANESNESDEIEPSEKDLVTASIASDSMKIANRELNDMIQMLTSSTTTNKSNFRPQQEGSAQTPCDTRKVTQILSSSGSHLDLLVQDDSSIQDHLDTQEVPEECSGPVRVSRKLSIKRRPSNVLKSQSMSFNQQQGLTTSQAISVGFCSGSDDKFRSTNGTVRNALPRRSASIKSSRPRSRIIFDPIKSEFHVSCSTDTSSDGSEQRDKDTVPEVVASLNCVRKGSLTLDSEESSASNDGDNNQGHSSPDMALDMNNIDESSLKLLEAQSKILSLKHLSVVRQVSDIGDGKDKQGGQPTISQSDNPKMSMQEPTPCQLPPKGPPPPPPSTKRCKSPVGSALRSLFGLKPNSSATNKQQQQQNTSQLQQHTRIPVDTSANCKKIATVMRHSSLRLDPRRQTIVFSGRGGIPSIENNSALKGAVPVPKSVSIDGGCAPLSSMNHCLQGNPPQSQQLPQQHIGSYSLGSDLLHRAGRRLSASSSSLTSRFKFIGSPSPSPSTNQ